MPPLFSGIGKQLTVLIIINTRVVAEKTFADMADWKPSGYWNRVICIMMIRTEYQNDIFTAHAL